MQNLVFKGLNGQFKIVAATQYITRIKDSTNKTYCISGSIKVQITSQSIVSFSILYLPVTYSVSYINL